MTISKDLLTKILSIFCIIASVVAIVFSVVACCLIKDDSERVYVETIAFNEDGDIVVTYSDESTVTLDVPAKGEDGVDGEDGKSAYELYLETVPEGETPMTVEEWLDSLKGADGKDGVDGENGKDGVTPTISINEDGYWVINGTVTDVKAVGTDGKDGVDGAAGAAGTNGTNGVGIADIYINEDKELTIVLTDHTVYSFPVSELVGEDEEQTPAVTKPSEDEEEDNVA